jgi:hypothetical protein
MRTLMLSVCLALTWPLAAQELTRPADWKVRFDQADADAATLYFVSMPPGWHITTGPAGIFYDPATTASGTYRVEAVIHLFDTKGRNREAFGFFIGGRDLEGDGQAYTYFLIRNDRNFLIKQRKGADTLPVTDWTPSDAIVTWESGDSVKNVLAAEVGAQSVDFFVNGAKVATVPRAGLVTDGTIGLRVNHALNVHVSAITVTPK